jgi:hypothetical protein
MGGPSSLGIFKLERGLRRCAGPPQVSAASAWRLPWAQGQAKPERPPFPGSVMDHPAMAVLHRGDVFS